MKFRSAWLYPFVFCLLCTPAWAQTNKIMIFGDSLSAAYGLAQKDGWVHLLGTRLSKEGISTQVINASISGETTAGGMRRIKALLDMHQPQIVVIELGANDGLRGFPLKQLQKNLLSLVDDCIDSSASVLLVGVQIAPNYGRAYTSGFERVFASVAQKRGLAFLPSIFAGIAGDKSLFQPDQLHPNAAAQPVILQSVWNHLLPLLETLK